MNASPLVALVTDFGLADSYVAEVHLAIRERVPSAQVLDVAHDLAPFDRTGAALVVERVVKSLPPGAVLAVVVDPGVGTERAPVAVRLLDRWVVGPDNGVLPPGPAYRIALQTPEKGVATFDGREVFGPAAALLAAGLDPRLLGPGYVLRVPWVLPDSAVFESLPGGLYATGVVIARDRYGNSVTSIRLPAGVSHAEVRAPEEFIGPLRRTYADVARGDRLALVGSSGRVELAVREGAAALPDGTVVEVRCVR